jgi:site-specific DNA recombinase
LGFISHKAEDTYLLTTKLYCGKCGALMFGESGVSHTGKMYTYYKCAAAKKKKTCDKKAVRKQWLEDLVVNETMKLVEDDASMNAIIAKVMELQNQESTDLPIYEKQLKETETGITNMLNAIQLGILTSSTKERLEALEEQRKELQARIAEERLAKPKMKEEFVRFWLLRFRKLDMTQPEQRQALVDTFINAIYLYDDKVLITFNYKEGTETVAFGEAVKAEKSSDMSARGAPENAVKSKDFMAFLLCNPEKSGLVRSMHGFCTVGFFVGILCIGWNCFEMRGKFCIRSTEPDGAAPLLRGRRSSEVPAERSWRWSVRLRRVQPAGWGFHVWRRNLPQTSCPVLHGRTAGYGRRCSPAYPP